MRWCACRPLLAGVAIGAIGLQGLHAQGAKQKAYSVNEFEILDKSAQAAYLPAARKAVEAAHGRPLRTSNGRVVQACSQECSDQRMGQLG